MDNTNPVAQENPVGTKENKDVILPVPYTEKEKEYISYLQVRLESARTARNQNHDEFDGMTYTQWYESNLKGANSFIAPKKNKEDTTIVTGTTRAAILALIAKINQLNLSPEVKAFDRNDKEDVHTGLAMENLILKADELDNDDEKKLLRQYELFVQGTVFVEETWTEEFITDKELNTKKWTGQVKDVSWTSRLRKVFEGCRRNLIPGVNVFLGSITEFDLEAQPYAFVVDYIPYDEAKALYGEWERWSHVTRTVANFSKATPQGIYFNNWRLQTTLQNSVEVIKYQDPWSNEFQIILNGVLMMPIGFPLPWKYRKYNFVKQVFEIITPYFAYGSSFVKKLKSAQALEDEFLRLLVLKTQISFKPPRGNLLGRLVSGRVFMPGMISPGIDPKQLPILTPEGQPLGATQSEVKMYELIKDNMADNSLSNLSQGQTPGGDQTATEVMQLQREAKNLMYLAVFSATMLEKKLAYLRLYDIIENWFEPVGSEADMVRNEIRQKYRSASVKSTIPGAGKGRRIIKATDTMPKQEPFPGKDDVYDEEEELSKAEGQPVRITYLNRDDIKNLRYNWYIEVNAREKESSELSKVLFNSMLVGLQQLGQLATTAPFLSLDFFEERFAEVWQLPADKAFQKQAQAALQGQPMPMAGGSPSPQPQPGQLPQQIQAGPNAAAQPPSLNNLLNAK